MTFPGGSSLLHYFFGLLFSSLQLFFLVWFMDINGLSNANSIYLWLSLKKNLFCKLRELLTTEFKGMRCELNLLQYTISATLDLENPL